ncbi:MAG: VWA domain-containing protein [Acidobacteria bacterium]|nr:VWA domain-containing protein [Acidobacteriota bacterium]
MNTKILHHVLRINIFAMVFLAIGAGGISAQEKPNPQMIRVESALVTVPVIANNAKGRFLGGLTSDDFKLFEDGIQVPISLFLTSEDPVKIALLIDTSQSTTTVLRSIKKAAEQFLLQMRPQDQALVVGFDTEIRTLCPLTSDPGELKEGIKKARSSGSRTRMRDTIHEIAQKKFRSLTGRKAIILLSDGQDKGSKISAGDLLNTVAASNTLIYSIFYKVDPRELMEELFGVESRNRRSFLSWEEQEKKAVAYLTQISELSAGRVYTSEVRELDLAFKQISEELRSQYLLGFYPDESRLDGSMHALEVRVSAPDAVIRSRRNYRSIPP